MKFILKVGSEGGLAGVLEGGLRGGGGGMEGGRVVWEVAAGAEWVEGVVGLGSDLGAKA